MHLSSSTRYRPSADAAKCRRPGLNRFSRLAIWLALLVWSLPAAARAEDHFEIHLSNDISVFYNDVSGPGSENSTLTTGTNYLEVLTVDASGQKGSVSYDFHLGGMMTDDPNYDASHYSLTHFNANIKSPHHALTIGDTFEAFSQYTLTSAVKGGAYKYLGGHRAWLPRVTLLYGQAAPRWDSLWGKRETETMERRIYGSRVEFGAPETLVLGLNLVGLDDRDPIEDFERVYDDSRFYSIDLRYKPIPGLTIYSEAAFNDAKVGIGDAEPTEDLEGYAVKVRAVGDQDPSRVVIEYERIDPEFENPVAAVTSDREKAKFMWRYMVTRNVHLHTNMLWFRDNLDHQLDAGTTHYYRPELGLAWSRPFGRRFGYVRLTYSKKIARQRGDKINDDDLVYLNYRDRFGVIDTDTNLGYTLYQKEGPNELDNDEILYNTTLRSRFNAGPFVFKPAVFLGGWNFRDELQNSDDRFYEYSVGLGVDIPDLRVSANIKAGRNRLDKEGGEDSSKNFGNAAIYWRPAFLNFLDRGTLFVQGYFNDFNFEDNDDDFREKSVTAGISMSI